MPREYRFTTPDGSLIGSVSESYRAECNRCEPGYETEAALQFFFDLPTTQMQELGNGIWLVGGDKVRVEIL